jgi:hypothetical protein
MKCLVHNQLTVLGPAAPLKQFLKTEFQKRLQARFFDWIEDSKGRFICQFDTDTLAASRLQRVSREEPKLTFLLHYEDEEARHIGAAKSKSGKLEHHQIAY